MNKENKHILRAVKGEEHEAVYWDDGGMDVKIKGSWFCRFENNDYVEADPARARMLEGVEKEDVRIRLDKDF